MEKIITYLEARKELTISLVLTYFIFILSMHDFMVNVSVGVMNSLTRQKYDLIVGSIMISAMLFILILFIRNLRLVRQAADIKIVYMLIMTSLLIIHIQMNFVMNIEIIHTLQFGILALMIFPLTRSFGATLFFTTLLGAADELFQYLVLYPSKNDYLDFNDIVLDQMGAAIVLVYLYSSGLRSERNWSQKWYYSPVTITVVSLSAVVAVMYHFSLITTYYSSATDKTLFVLNESNEPEGFWRHMPNCDIVFHVMSPIEGVIAIVMIGGLFFFLDYLDRKNAAIGSQEPYHSSEKPTGKLREEREPLLTANPA